MKLTSFILAGWLGSRMKEITDKSGVPKHLLPLWNGETPVSRLVRQLSSSSDRIICVVRIWQEELYRDLVSGIQVVSWWENNKNFSDMPHILRNVQNKSDMLLFTTGDLVFDDGVMEEWLKSITNSSFTHVFTRKWECFCWLQVPLFCTPTIRMKQILTSLPENKKVRDLVGPLIFKYGTDFLYGRVKRKNIPLIANINTPLDFEIAKKILNWQGIVV